MTLLKLPHLTRRESLRRNARASDTGDSGWMLTLNDLLLLLLTFFVMRFAAGHLPEIPAIQSGVSKSRIALESREGKPVVSRDYEDLRQELLQIFTVDHPVETNPTGATQRIHFVDGVTLERQGEHSVLSLMAPFNDATPEELTFRAATIIRTAAKISVERSRAIELTIFADSKLARDSYSGEWRSDWELAERQLGVVLRQMIDTGVDPQALFAGVQQIALPAPSPSKTFSENSSGRLQVGIRQGRS